MSGALLVLLQASLYTGAVARRPREAGLFATMLAAVFGFLHVVPIPCRWARWRCSRCCRR